MRLAGALATLGGLGDRLPAPGTTAGSPAGVLLFVAVAALFPAAGAAPAWGGLAVVCVVGVWACGAEAAHRAADDPGPVVLDEVAGQWLALAMLGDLGVPAAGTLALSFVLFRLFDVIKPWPIRRLERLPGGWGIVADDLAAGLAAGLVHLAARALP